MNFIWEKLDMSCEKFRDEEILNEFFLMQFNLFKNEKAKDQTKASYVLLKRLLAKQNIDIDNQKILANKFGKPYFVDIPVFFNISHSENLCVATLSNKPIGIDIQIYSSPNKKIEDRYFDKRSKLRMKLSPNKTKAFTMGWTTHESTLKLFSNLRFKSQNVKTKFFFTTDSQNKKYVVAISQNN